MGDTKIFDIIANLIASIEKNYDIIHKYKSSRNSKIEKKACEIVTKAAETDNYSKIEKISQLVDKDDSVLEYKLYILFAIDSIFYGKILGANATYPKMFKNTQSATYLNSKSSADLTHIKIYFTFPMVMNRKRENIDNLGMHLKNIAYYSGEYTLNNVYIKKKEFDLADKNKIKIRIIPYSKKYKTGYFSIENNGRKYFDPFYNEDDNKKSNILKKYTSDEIADERIEKSLKKVIDDNYDFVLLPETLKPEIAEIVFNKCRNHRTIVVGPAFYENADNNRKLSKIYVTSNLFLGGRITVKKTKSYMGKIEIDGISYEENIITNKEYTILHIEGVGRILFLICSDWFYINQGQGQNLIYSMNIDIVFIVSCTESYNEFDKYYNYFRKENRVFIQSNLCSECLKKEPSYDLVPCNHNFDKKLNFDVRKCNCEKKISCYIKTIIKKDENGEFDLIVIEQK